MAPKAERTHCSPDGGYEAGHGGWDEEESIGADSQRCLRSNLVGNSASRVRTATAAMPLQPLLQSPLTSLIDALISHKSPSTSYQPARSISSLFHHVPDKRLYPDYYMFIKEPRSLVGILVSPVRAGAGRGGGLREDRMDAALELAGRSSARAVVAGARRVETPADTRVDLSACRTV